MIIQEGELFILESYDSWENYSRILAICRAETELDTKILWNEYTQREQTGMEMDQWLESQGLFNRWPYRKWTL